jgi:hypothetical protein
MKIEKITKRLKTCMITGFVVDACMVVIFILPSLRVMVFGENPVLQTPLYEWGIRLVGSLGAGWTLLLLWASRKPLKRKDILLFTVFPLMAGAFAATVYAFLQHTVSLQFFLLFTFITLAHCPYFMFIWIKATRAVKNGTYECKQ